MTVLYHETGSTWAPYNLALEEAMAEAVGRGGPGRFMLWQNGPSVIIGRYQNAFSEVNLPELKRRGHDLVRRMTGGGAVYHDLGNLNFTFILPLEGRSAYAAEEVLTPLVGYFRDALGLPVVMEGRNDLTIPGQGKFSGLAGRRLPGAWQLHGTLLHDVDLGALERDLLVDPDKYRSKGVSSVRTRVTNLRPHVSVSLAELWAGLKAAYGHPWAPLPEIALARTRELVENKYSLESWNVGQSPPGDLTLQRRFPFGSLELRLSLAKNSVTEAKLTGDFMAGGDEPGETPVERLAEALIGLPADRRDEWARAWSGFSLEGAFRGQVDREAILGWLAGEEDS